MVVTVTFTGTVTSLRIMRLALLLARAAGGVNNISMSWLAPLRLGHSFFLANLSNLKMKHCGACSRTQAPTAAVTL